MIHEFFTSKLFIYSFGILIVIAVFCSVVMFYIFEEDISQDTLTHDTTVQARQPKVIVRESTGPISNIEHDNVETHSQKVKAHNQYDWREDTSFKQPKEDVWKTLNSKKKSNTYQNTEKESKTYPPEDWYETEDTELFYTYYQAQLIKQFGDIKEVKIVVDREYKRAKGVPVKLDEQIEYLEAQNHLWPDKNTLKALETLRKLKSEEYQDATMRPHPHHHSDEHTH